MNSKYILLAIFAAIASSQHVFCMQSSSSSNSSGEDEKHQSKRQRKNGPEISLSTNQADRKLLESAARGDLDGVKEALSDGADIAAMTVHGTTALHLAIAHPDILAELLTHQGVQIDARTHERQRTPLHTALRYHRTGAALLLIRGGANIHVQDIDGISPLHLAAADGNADVVRELLARHVDVDLPGKNKTTALHYAAYHGREDVVGILVQHGASVLATDEWGQTAMMFAAAAGFREIVGMLLKAGSEINARNDDGQTALYWAALRGHHDVVNLLSDARAESVRERPQLIVHTPDQPGRVVHQQLRFLVDVVAQDLLSHLLPS